MTSIDLRGYARAVAALARDPSFGQPEREHLLGHAAEVSQLLWLSNAEALKRDELQIMRWLEHEWATLGRQMPKQWSHLHLKLSAALAVPDEESAD